MPLVTAQVSVVYSQELLGYFRVRPRFRLDTRARPAPFLACSTSLAFRVPVTSTPDTMASARRSRGPAVSVFVPGAGSRGLPPPVAPVSQLRGSRHWVVCPSTSGARPPLYSGRPHPRQRPHTICGVASGRGSRSRWVAGLFPCRACGLSAPQPALPGSPRLPSRRSRALPDSRSCQWWTLAVLCQLQPRLGLSGLWLRPQCVGTSLCSHY